MNEYLAVLTPFYDITCACKTICLQIHHIVVQIISLDHVATAARQINKSVINIILFLNYVRLLHVGIYMLYFIYIFNKFLRRLQEGSSLHHNGGVRCYPPFAEISTSYPF